MQFRLVVLPGDGIGPEVTEQALKVLKRVEERFAHRFLFEKHPAGGEAIDACGEPLPKVTLKACLGADAVLKAPMGGPRWDKLPTEKRPEAGILALRKGLDLYANLRPVKVYDALVEASTLKPEVVRGIDLLIVRELISGIYFGEPRGIFGEGKDRYGVNTEKYHYKEVERLMRLAFALARKRRRKVTSVDKFNVLESSRLWHDVAEEVAKDYPDVEFQHLIVDNAAMQLIRNPKAFDVLATTNMFGDILSDEAAQLTGSLGMLPSASIGGKVSLYEPAGGSAPDVAGKDIANPLAMILCTALMLRFSFDLEEEAKAVEKAVESVLNRGLRTADLAEPGAKSIGCKAMGDAVAEAILEQ